MKALSLRQPWAWMVVHGGKNIENRSWNTRFRGEFLIHAAKGLTSKEFADACRWARARGFDHVVDNLPDTPLERGGIVGIARLVDVVPPRPPGCVCEEIDQTDRPCLTCEARGHQWHMHEQFGFVLEDVRPLPFQPCRGMLGFFEVEP